MLHSNARRHTNGSPRVRHEVYCREEKSIRKTLESKIDNIQNSVGVNDSDQLETLRQCLEDLDIKEDEEAARKLMAKYKLEGEKTTKFFYKMSRKMKNKAQFDTLLVKEVDQNGIEHEREITKQSSIDWEVHKFYWKLYRSRR